MSASWIAANLWAYSLQVLIVAAAGTAVVLALRLRDPAARLAHWQIVLAACLAAPLLQPWRDVVAEGTITFRLGATQPASGAGTGFAWPSMAVVLWVLGAGVIVRALWLGVGILRLHRLRKESLPFPIPERVESVRRQLGVNAEILLSTTVSGPVTFGFRRPVILVPESFLSAASQAQTAVACHELLHVKRRDWLRVLGEEALRAVLWFHPAVWWVLGQIQISREQVVDREVIRLTGERDHYLEALLAIAAAQSGADLAPAPLFLRKSHLAQRVAIILKEVSMPKRKLMVSMIAGSALTLFAGGVGVALFPLQAPAQQESKAPQRIRVGGNVQSAKLKTMVRPKYPPEAKEQRIEGTVRLEATIAKDGTVKNLVVQSGPSELVDSALEAVKQWVYETTLLNGEPVEVITMVDVNYTLAK